MKKYLSIICAAAMMLSACDKKEDNAVSTKPIVKIGATLPLSGDAAIFGNMSKEALMMALQKWQKQDTKYNYKLIFSDDMVKFQQAALNANRFINIEGVKAILSIWGTVDRVVDEIADKNNVISMSCTLGKGKLPPLAICNETANEDYAELLTKELKKHHAQKIALIILNGNANVNLGDYLQEYFLTHGLEVTDYIKTNADMKDYRMIITKAEQKNPDYYIMQMGAPGMDIFVKQFMEMKPSGKLTTVWNFAELSSDILPLIEGQWFVRGEDGSEEFKSEFKKITGTEPNSCTANSYDNLDMFIWAYENTPVHPGETFPYNKDVIQKIKSIRQWKGAVGKFDVDKQGLVRNKPSVQIYENGNFVKLKD